MLALITTRVCGKVMFSVMSVCLCVCLSVFLSVQAITFEPLNIETSFLVCRYILTISRSSLSIKVIRSRSRSYEKKYFTYFNLLILCMWPKVINKVKVTRQGHIKVKVKYLLPFQLYIKFYLSKHINPLYVAIGH